MASNRKKKNTFIKALVMTLAVVFVVSCFFAGGDGSVAVAESFIKLIDKNIDTGLFNYLDDSVVFKLPSAVKDTDIISVIVQMKDQPSVLDEYEKTITDMTFSEFAKGKKAQAIRKSIDSEKEKLIKILEESKVSFETGKDYSAIVSGFEIIITARDFETVAKALGKKANTYISEAYKTEETKLVENKVNVYDTGIFNSSQFGYDGTGIVVAVLDTGLDYTHTAFSVNNFTADESKLGLTFEDVAAVLDDSVAAEMNPGLTASDVYVNKKVPFAFDYADEDSDVYPISSDHGTHVSGIIAGKDDTITGVAPNAQIVSMKIFSDTKDSAYTAWILAALEDCAVLGVDVINMSIGTACGFSRENDKEFISGVYDRIRKQGISMVVAASNSFNSTYGSEKNGNLGLTSNPDSATVGSPSTYPGVISVASVSGVKTPYMLYGDTIIYFTESTDRVSEEKVFVDELLEMGVDSLTVEYITIPGAGRSADYTGIDVTGKVVLVSRGSTTFEEKANVAQEKGAIGLIIYNNVSGDIKMNVGDTMMAVCSISQDDGEMLAAAGTGTLTVSRANTSGPFMSDFSSWGPAPDLSIKPEITAHGGSIYSAVPGQGYDRISGTSMACPNISGITVLLRQYVKENFPELKEDPVAITRLVNQLMMSTADILLNKNGLPYSVRKQGAGLANLDNCAKTTAYIVTYDRATGNELDKSKIELGDDPSKTGVYDLVFSVVNFGESALSYDVSAFVMTEGVSDTKTAHGATTVTEEAQLLGGAKVEIKSVENGTLKGNNVTVNANSSAKITVTVTLSDEDKQYMDESFANGMYVEGFVVLTAKNGTEIDLGVPYLAFYGDWTLAPIFDLDYYATNKDELDDSLDLVDKTLPDAYATRPIGGINGDYVSYLGSFYFQQDPSVTPIAADRKYISLTNQEDGVNSLRFVWAGLLRNAARVDITITDDATGEVVFERTENDIRKSYGDGGSIYPANIKIEFSAIEHNLKNNTTYTVNLKSYLDYSEGGGDTNLSNEFSFPLVTDFEAPAITDCEFYTEYDSSNKELRYFAKLKVYDNHYAMGLQVGYVGLDDAGTGYMLNSFNQYLTPVYSEFNTDTYVIYELTDYIDIIRQNATNRNTITVACYDYALNQATYEIALPDDYLDITFGEEEIVISPYEVVDLMPLVYPETEWSELLEFFCTQPASGEVGRVVNNQLVGVNPGTAVVIARDPVTKKQATINLRVLSETDEGYVRYDKPVLDKFALTGYTVNKAYFYLNSVDRDIGVTGDEMKFAGQQYSLEMFPSESVSLNYQLDAFFPDVTDVVFESSNEKIVTVDQNGVITGVAEGFASVSVRVTMDGKSTYYSQSINITIKDPYITTGASLTHYFGLGGEVIIPETLSLTEIGQYAFSNFDYIPKEPHEITEAEPDSTKIWYIGDSTITTVIIPEGVEKIGPYAFANLTALKTVVLPSTLKTISQGAFYGCTSLTTIKGLENVQFINQGAFYGCNLKGDLKLENAVAVADYSFAFNEKLDEVVLSKKTQSIGAYAFTGCKDLDELVIEAEYVKLGQYVFSDCTSLKEISVNSAVIPAGAFSGCKKLKTVTLGKDVSVIGEYAFGGTAVEKLTFASGNESFVVSKDGKYVTNKAGDTLMLVLPSAGKSFELEDKKITKIGNGAFSGNKNIKTVDMPYVTEVGEYAFAGCEELDDITLGVLTYIGKASFMGTAITELPDLKKITDIGDYAFANSALTEVNVPNNVNIGEYAFSGCKKLNSVVIGDNVTVGNHAFYNDTLYNWEAEYYTVDDIRYYYYVFVSPIEELIIGENVIIGDYAFNGASTLTSVELGANAVIGDYAFYNAVSLESVDLSKVKSIGNYSFSGDVLYMALDSTFTNLALDENGYYMYSYNAPALKEIDLASATNVGEYAFAHCKKLEKVFLGDNVTALLDGTFSCCDALSDINLEKVTEINGYALDHTALISVELGNAEFIGEYAFCENGLLESVTLNKNGVVIGEGAFAYCTALDTLTNEEFTTEFGDYSFAYTALVSVDLTAASHIGQHAFIKESRTEFDVVLGSALATLGDNPFAMCEIKPFNLKAVIEFNGVQYEKDNFNFDLSESVKVIDGSLYQTVPYGLELVTYAGVSDAVTVADDTVRISAFAFAGTDAKQVILPYTVYSIGHKAFFKCDELEIVSFSSYNAPVLEEEYDYMYFVTGDNISATGEYTFTAVNGDGEISKNGLGVTPYFMWNAAENASSVYYGANFTNYIGHIDNKLVMVRPANGNNYGSFIFNQYFATVINGAAAADELTVAAINAIKALPETVSLEDKDLVLAARAAYDKISTLEQKALVTNYNLLTQAEKRISDLEYLANSESSADDTSVDTDGGNGGVIAIIIVSVVVIAVAGVAGVFVILRKKNNKKTDATSEVKDTPVDDSSDN